jgi:hypothetical protein
MVGLADQPEFVSSNAGKEFLTTDCTEYTDKEESQIYPFHG